MVIKDILESNISKAANLKEPLHKMFTEAQSHPELVDFLNFAYSGESSVDDTNCIIPENCIHLSTVHGAKGLEFNTVFIVNCDDNNFPCPYSTVPDDNRLLYVAVTRARSECCFCC